MRGLLILIVVLAIALVVGDRVAVVLAQNEIARAIAAEYELPGPPSVTIGGFPFLTQAVEGSYHTIDVGVGDWTGQDTTVNDLAVRLSDVAAPLADVIDKRTSSLVATTATATAVVPYDTVENFAPSGVESIADSPDGLRVTGTFSIQGIPVPATVFVTVTPTEDGIEVTPISAQPAIGGPTIPLAMLRQTLTFVVPLQQLPLGARLTEIQPGADGLHVTAVANEVSLSDLP
ncbi:LmeA family phospholipid-binding protein [Nocardia mangyaensis]|uniref:LmeA family phospholipid-binding protein n=1 Tax=Nocardia mangyaensis TaxID=2213200 RepID=UPI0026765E36|nr:DUF2993 domain-containing protein [Nocardia mangyaensis]MDO3651197.1 DUF2993 domain-containing protein [Nocardia mangyaensis]